MVITIKYSRLSECSMDNGLRRTKDATEISRQHQNHTTLSRHWSDSKPEAEGYFEQIQKSFTRIKGQTDEQLLEKKMLEDNEEQ